MNDISGAAGKHWYFGVTDVLRLSLRSQHEPILRQRFWIDVFFRHFELNVQPSRAAALSAVYLLERRLQPARHNWSVRPVVKEPVIRSPRVPRFAIRTDPGLVLDHDPAHRNVRF